jgi:tRNA(Ile)-lysidine synthase
VSSKKGSNHFSAALLAQQLSLLLPRQRPLHLRVAFSGGVDSHVLLHALCELRSGAHWQLSAIHVNHGLNERSSRWAEHCHRVCRQLDVPLITETVQIDTGDRGLEAAARDARYSAISRHIEMGDVLLTAHHRDDQLETVLLHLVRGTGAHGLAGMAPVRDFSTGKHVRPLLAFNREMIEYYARDVGLEWIEDDSNTDMHFGRNFLRHRIVPALKAHWPGADSVIARSAGHAAAAAELLDDLAQQDIARCRGVNIDSLSLSACAGLPRSRLQNMLRYWIRQSALSPAESRHIEEIIHQVQYPSRTGKALVSWAGGGCLRYRDELSLTTAADEGALEYEIRWDTAKPVIIAPLGIKMDMRAIRGAGLAACKIRGAEVVLRNRRGGESLRLRGRQHRHKLKKLFQESGMSPRERNRLPLIYVDGELAAVGNRWITDSFAAGEREDGLILRIQQIL